MRGGAWLLKHLEGRGLPLERPEGRGLAVGVSRQAGIGGWSASRGAGLGG